MNYRIKENNGAYNCEEGNFLGWIFCTNKLTFSSAYKKIMSLRNKKNSLKYEMVKVK